MSANLLTGIKLDPFVRQSVNEMWTIRASVVEGPVTCRGAAPALDREIVLGLDQDRIQENEEVPIIMIGPKEINKALITQLDVIGKLAIQSHNDKMDHYSG